MTFALLITIVLLLAGALYDAVRGTGRPVAGVAAVAVSVALTLPLSRGVDWVSTIPYWVWPVLAALGALAVGIRTARLAATPRRSREDA
ncbi:hypothetical protein [Corynebacterium timonense]|uniref:Uncharacterized protein n=1 Tax=Corynebacterium timonense TaxID=441500 RepID=A0A1H1Q1A7_9CORY|nr:hypothetical protein [Corynebacterium timonense]SDS17113.1 hypothetical protein SAMN04488539_1150 [Corynebacterium timonense]